MKPQFAWVSGVCPDDDDETSQAERDADDRERRRFNKICWGVTGQGYRRNQRSRSQSKTKR